MAIGLGRHGDDSRDVFELGKKMVEQFVSGSILEPGFECRGGRGAVTSSQSRSHLKLNLIGTG